MPAWVVATPKVKAAGSRPLDTLEVLLLPTEPTQAPPTSVMALADSAFSQLE